MLDDDNDGSVGYNSCSGQKGWISGGLKGVLREVIIDGNQTLALGEADLAATVLESVSITVNQAGATAKPGYCVFYPQGSLPIPPANLLAHRLAIAWNASLGANGNGLLANTDLLPPGIFDLLCFVDTDSSGAVSGGDFTANRAGENIAGTGTAISGFSLIP